MEKEYSISVSMQPYYRELEKDHYFWAIFEGSNKSNVSSGWALTPELAWQAALASYQEEVVEKDETHEQ